jgi:hypothetical protein
MFFVLAEQISAQYKSGCCPLFCYIDLLYALSLKYQEKLIFQDKGQSFI